MNEADYQRVFRVASRAYGSRPRRAFLRDMRDSIADEPAIYDIVTATPETPRYVAVSCDRTYNVPFSYPYFDMVLDVLGRLHGGRGVYKPIHQNRVIMWRNTRPSLLKVLRHMRNNFPVLRFSRAVVLPYPRPVAGYRLEPHAAFDV